MVIGNKSFPVNRDGAPDPLAGNKTSNAAAIAENTFSAKKMSMGETTIHSRINNVGDQRFSRTTFDIPKKVTEVTVDIPKVEVPPYLIEDFVLSNFGHADDPSMTSDYAVPLVFFTLNRNGDYKKTINTGLMYPQQPEGNTQHLENSAAPFLSAGLAFLCGSYQNMWFCLTRASESTFTFAHPVSTLPEFTTVVNATVYDTGIPYRERMSNVCYRGKLTVGTGNSAVTGTAYTAVGQLGGQTTLFNYIVTITRQGAISVTEHTEDLATAVESLGVVGATTAGYFGSVESLVPAAQSGLNFADRKVAFCNSNEGYVVETSSHGVDYAGATAFYWTGDTTETLAPVGWHFFPVSDEVGRIGYYLNGSYTEISGVMSLINPYILHSIDVVGLTVSCGDNNLREFYGGCICTLNVASRSLDSYGDVIPGYIFIHPFIIYAKYSVVIVWLYNGTASVIDAYEAPLTTGAYIENSERVCGSAIAVIDPKEAYVLTQYLNQVRLFKITKGVSGGVQSTLVFETNDSLSIGMHAGIVTRGDPRGFAGTRTGSNKATLVLNTSTAGYVMIFEVNGNTATARRLDVPLDPQPKTHTATAFERDWMNKPSALRPRSKA